MKHTSKSKALVSIVLGSYNRKAFLQLTIKSIRDELKDFSEKTEIIVVDGGSDDGSINWLVQQKDIISIIQHNRGIWQGMPIERRSWGYFMNLGFKAAEGKYVCMVSDDCLLVPGALKNAFRQFENDLASGAKTGGIAFFFRDLPEATQFYVNYTINNTCMINHGIFLKEALEKVNYIDEDNYFFYHADDDLALKLFKAGYIIQEAEASYIEHFLHANIDIRAQVYESERRDYAALIAKWENEFVISKPDDIHSRTLKSFDYKHPLMPLFFRLYQNDLASKRRTAMLKKIRRHIRHFFSEVYYVIKYMLTSFALLFYNPKKLAFKIKTSFRKYFN